MGDQPITRQRAGTRVGSPCVRQGLKACGCTEFWASRQSPNAPHYDQFDSDCDVGPQYHHTQAAHTQPSALPLTWR
ncbi:hypothetical protein SKAU_G00103460 [Synaphobranchus kaupii]|uniref:Uncharacterized protein n=1 Tax=Synaphobranchus kaupii TaxID=118154 RepID=A0A9Q1FZU1_SYNKA|nr:hypothetical protein SKAU_G00103460 [Synaphobranchus kaupii]